MRKHKLTVLGVLLAAVAAFAVSHSFSGTINTPAVPTWVDGSGNEIAPYVILGPLPAYVAPSTGYLWTIHDILSSPSAGGTSRQGAFYTTNNCTGTVYLFEPTDDLPSTVHEIASAGNFYVTNGAAAVSTQTQLLNGSCTAAILSSDIYNAIGPLTPPTLTAAPWHLEAR